ncbi:MAG: DUF3793 family protein [Geobacteraceae bacterium]|nr:DUF3793 family protein [Geobacteraceae bacterium]
MGSQLSRTVPPLSPWNAIAARFPDERDCLASYLALESAEVVAGVKPGNLVNVVNRKRPCGRNPYALWRRDGGTLLAASELAVLELLDRRSSLLLYIFREDLLQELLDRKPVAAILERCGYREPANLQATLADLQLRLRSGSFPHEIGIFLGYPLKDVLAFMGQITLPFACQGPWKIYGNPRQSLELAERFRECRCRMAFRLAGCDDPALCLQEAA